MSSFLLLLSRKDNFFIALSKGLFISAPLPKVFSFWYLSTCYPLVQLSASIMQGINSVMGKGRIYILKMENHKIGLSNREEYQI